MTASAEHRLPQLQAPSTPAVDSEPATPSRQSHALKTSKLINIPPLLPATLKLTNEFSSTNVSPTMRRKPVSNVMPHWEPGTQIPLPATLRFDSWWFEGGERCTMQITYDTESKLCTASMKVAVHGCVSAKGMVTYTQRQVEPWDLHVGARLQLLGKQVTLRKATDTATLMWLDTQAAALLQDKTALQRELEKYRPVASRAVQYSEPQRSELLELGTHEQLPSGGRTNLRNLRHHVEQLVAAVRQHQKLFPNIRSAVAADLVATIQGPENWSVQRPDSNPATPEAAGSRPGSLSQPNTALKRSARPGGSSSPAKPPKGSPTKAPRDGSGNGASGVRLNPISMDAILSVPLAASAAGLTKTNGTMNGKGAPSAESKLAITRAKSRPRVDTALDAKPATRVSTASPKTSKVLPPEVNASSSSTSLVSPQAEAPAATQRQGFGAAPAATAAAGLESSEAARAATTTAESNLGPSLEVSAAAKQASSSSSSAPSTNQDGSAPGAQRGLDSTAETTGVVTKPSTEVQSGPSGTEADVTEGGKIAANEVGGEAEGVVVEGQAGEAAEKAQGKAEEVEGGPEAGEDAEAEGEGESGVDGELEGEAQGETGVDTEEETEDQGDEEAEAEAEEQLGEGAGNEVEGSAEGEAEGEAGEEEEEEAEEEVDGAVEAEGEAQTGGEVEGEAEAEVEGEAGVDGAADEAQAERNGEGQVLGEEETDAAAVGQGQEGPEDDTDDDGPGCRGDEDNAAAEEAEAGGEEAGEVDAGGEVDGTQPGQDEEQGAGEGEQEEEGAEEKDGEAAAAAEEEEEQDACGKEGQDEGDELGQAREEEQEGNSAVVNSTAVQEEGEEKQTAGAEADA